MQTLSHSQTLIVEVDGQFHLVNVNLHSSNGREIVNTESFEHLILSFDCIERDGAISITFNSDEAFQNAVKIWSQATHDEGDDFLLVTNHGGCGPAEERQPYIVSKVIEDERIRTTFLVAQPANWSTVATTYDVEIGERVHDTSRGLQRRGLGQCKDGKCPPFQVPVNSGNNGKSTKLYSNDNFELDCANCNVAGTFVINAGWTVSKGEFLHLTLDASPINGFKTAVDLKTTFKGDVTPKGLGYTKAVVPPTAIPDVGVEVPGLFTLGAQVAFDVGFTTKFAGEATFAFGLDSTIAPGAKASIDITNQGQSTAVGFQPKTQPHASVDELSASASFTVFAQPKLILGLKGKGLDLDIELDFTVPSFTTTLTAKSAADGACPNYPNKKGASLSFEAGVEVKAKLEAAAGAKADTQRPKWEKSLFSKKFPVSFKPCLPIGGGSAGGKGGKPSPSKKQPPFPLPSKPGSPVGTAPVGTGTSAPLLPLKL